LCLCTAWRASIGAPSAQGQGDSTRDSSGAAMAGMPGMGGPIDSLQAPSGRSIVPMIKSPMIPGLEGAHPTVDWYSPGRGQAARTITASSPSAEMRVKTGDTIALSAGLVRRTIAGRSLVVYAFNGESPGPLIRVTQGATFYVRFRNNLDQPATVHWHGVRLQNAYDGTPQMTQAPVAPGGTFLYAVHCPDAGIFWYHDHVREDIGQPLGLYGNIDVERAGASAPATHPRQAFMIVSDILIDGDSLMPFGREAPNFSLMGRFGNVLLVNGEARWHLTATAGEVVQFVMTNAASARTFNLSFGDAQLKVVATGQSPYPREVPVSSVIIAPGERYVVDVRFDRPGEVAILNRVQTVDHFLGEIYPNSDTLGHVTVTGQRAGPEPGFATVHEDSGAIRDIARVRSAFDRPPDEEVVLTTAIHGLPIPVMQMMAVDTAYRPPVEWTDGMSDMNWLATAKEVQWVIRDAKTGAENMKIRWHYHVGDVIKIRVYNDPRSFHPMDHPLHLHGQRFIEVARDGRPNPYPVWKDTIIIPVGSTVDLLVELTNPGTWMFHCHIAEHAESGMMAPVVVTER
jgi:suppressor of ftsI